MYKVVVGQCPLTDRACCCAGLNIVQPEAVKVSVGDVFTKKMELKNNEHVREQHKTIQELTRLGYEACFGIGFEKCKSIIDNYFLYKENI